MRTVVIFVSMMMIANLAVAETLKERLKRAREEEASVSVKKTQPIVEKTGVPQEGTESRTPQDQPQSLENCPSDPQVEGDVSYYRECYCQAQTYPQIDTALKPYGLTYIAQGIKEFGDGPIHNDPKERAQYRYTCGVSLMWDSENVIKFSKVDECYAFVDKVLAIVKTKKTPYLATSLYYGCGQRVASIQNPSTP